MRFRKYPPVVLLMALLLFACNKDAVEQPGGIVGKWNLKKTRARFYRNGVLYRDTSATNYTPAHFQVFNSDSSGYVSWPQSSGSAIFTFKYTLNGNLLKTTDTRPGSPEFTYTVIKLTQSSLELTFETSISTATTRLSEIENYTYKRE
ncbi:hypothetical protein [Mucilaginibacter celer]|uniref:Lipocalin-like domain-containing protein n=1 Tax=Mucilaginibacter celer TaxID=2305508 RepID=A0A494VZL6_9SPHI|nr:hypothetical protein [Mucilaginibacter celer]AYL96412.1 hypothetical protein HYN43_014385 [Mucilaginibacter celer]